MGAATFPVSRAPPRNATTGLYEPAATDLKHADLTYLDVNGRTVNTASFGAGVWLVDATRWDSFGNVTWALDAGNRAQALVPTSSTDPYVAGRATSAERAELLATVSTYTADGADLLTSLGPTHPVMLASGLVASARTETKHTYDVGAPAGGPYHLVSDTFVKPVPVDGTATTAADTIQTQNWCSAVVAGDIDGWTMRAPTASVIVPGGTNIVSKVSALT